MISDLLSGLLLQEPFFQQHELLAQTAHGSVEVSRGGLLQMPKKPDHPGCEMGMKKIRLLFGGYLRLRDDQHHDFTQRAGVIFGLAHAGLTADVQRGKVGSQPRQRASHQQFFLLPGSVWNHLAKPQSNKQIGILPTGGLRSAVAGGILQSEYGFAEQRRNSR
jgi:hypothetical protein